MRTWLLLGLTGCFLGPSHPIAEALHRCDGRLPRENVKGAGDMAAMTVRGTDAHCNDGTPPMMYLRAATDPAHKDDWVIFVEGGGACGANRACQERWCAMSPPYTANKMSSKYGSDLMSGEGLLSKNPANPFAGYNAVELKYCSSDIWLGDANKPVELSGLTSSFTLWFQGHRVMLALLDALDAGAVSDNGQQHLPRLKNAHSIVFSGASGGGRGALQHMDLVSSRYPQAKVLGMLDGWNSPDFSTWTGGDQQTARSAHDEIWSGPYEQVWHAWTDPDCKGVACTNAYDLMAHAVTTPLLVRHDMYDPGTSDTYTQRGIPLRSFAEAITRTAHEEAKLRDDLSILEMACGEHIILPSEGYFTMKVTDADHGGRAWSVASAAQAVLDGQKVVAIDDPSRKGSQCGGAGSGNRERQEQPQPQPQQGRERGGRGGRGGR